MEVIWGRRQTSYCGPAVLSLISRKPVEYCAWIVLQLRAKNRGKFGYQCLGSRDFNRVHGMSITEFQIALKELGYEAIYRPDIECWEGRKYPTMARFLKISRPHRHSDQIYILGLVGHVMVLKGIKLYDNSNPKGVFIRQYDKRRRRVRNVWSVRKLP